MPGETLRALRAIQILAASVAFVAFFLALVDIGILDQDFLAIIGLGFLALATAAAIVIVALDPDSVLTHRSRSGT